MSEIVAPAGNFSKLQIAILYGADAIYFSGVKYGLRMGADNFSWEEIAKGIATCHQHSRKAYITLNSYFHDQDFTELLDYLKFLESLNVNAVICSDLGVVQFVKENTNIPVHLSTQAFVLNSWHAKVWKKMGVKRIVLGRELSLQQAAKIKQEVNIEVELFVHGAMCMSYSGHCTISNYTAGRDSNRGGCIQSCRHVYNIKNSSKQKTLLSSKDLNGSDYFQNFLNYKIDAAKIEGRMKSELYLATTVRAYKGLKDSFVKKKLPLVDWQEDLKKIPHRGYTSGSLAKKVGIDSVYEANKTSSTKYKFLGIIIFYDENNKRIFLHCKNPIQESAPIEILSKYENFLLTINDLQNIKSQKIQHAKADTVVSFYNNSIPNNKFSSGLIIRYLNIMNHLQEFV